MDSSLVMLLLLMTPQSSTNADDLFTKLDRDADGQVSRDEISESQQKFFQRALRVADVNEDGSLSSEELNRAVTDPRPVELPGQNMSQRRANFNPEMLDRDRDGRITTEEVPGPLRERFEQMLDRVGQKSVAVDQLEAFLRGERPEPVSTNAGREEEMMNSKSAVKSGTSPRPGDPKTRGKAERAKNKRSDDMGTPETFRSLDRNTDGKLTGDEIPPRLRQTMRVVDSDRDGDISRSEFAEAAKRRMQNPTRDEIP
jgi:Ca2+-binding EF-hand superfamily protein